MDGGFDHERLEVYRRALTLGVTFDRIVPKRGQAVLRDQIDRASGSVVLCIAEGAGRRTPSEKRNFYSMARGSATECAAALDLLCARRVLPDATHATIRNELLIIVRMLSRLSDAGGPPAPIDAKAKPPPKP